MTSVAAVALALAALAADPEPPASRDAPSGAAPAPATHHLWAVRIELQLGGLAYDGISGPDPKGGGGGLALGAGLHVRRGIVEGGVQGLATSMPLSSESQQIVGVTLGVSLPLQKGSERSAWRLELLAEGGAEKVTGAGGGWFAGEPAPPVTLPYAGGRAGVSARIRAREADVVLGAWWIEWHDLGTRDTLVKQGSGAGNRYTVGGTTRGLLLRVGIEL